MHRCVKTLRMVGRGVVRIAKCVSCGEKGYAVAGYRCATVFTALTVLWLVQIPKNIRSREY